MSAIFGSSGNRLAFLLPFIAGIIFGLAWNLVLDAATYSSHIDDPVSFEFTSYLPGIFASIAFFLLNSFAWSYLEQGSLNPSNASIAKALLFLSVLMFVGCIFGSFYIAFDKYGSDSGAKSNWPGAAIVLQNILLLVAAVIYRVAMNKQQPLL